MDFPEELKYSREHHWVRVEGDRAVIGLTDFAQHELGIIKAVELPRSVEARKTVAELYAPLGGEVLEVNEELEEAPEVINDDPYDGGWLALVRIADPEELKLLLSADDYMEYISEKE